MDTNKKIVNIEIIIYIILAICYLVYNIYKKHKFTVLLFILIVLLYIILHKTIIKNKNHLFKNLPILLSISVIISYIYNYLFSLVDEEKNENDLFTYLQT